MQRLSDPLRDENDQPRQKNQRAHPQFMLAAFSPEPCFEDGSLGMLGVVKDVGLVSTDRSADGRKAGKGGFEGYIGGVFVDLKPVAHVDFPALCLQREGEAKAKKCKRKKSEFHSFHDLLCLSFLFDSNSSDHQRMATCFAEGFVKN